MSSSIAPSEATIRKALNEFRVTVDDHQIGQIQEYMKLLLAWNDKVNLTAIRDPLEILYRHFCESMFVASIVDMRQCRIADIGAGGGFPGLPLKILLPDSTVSLVESNVKKATFLAEVVRTLKLGDTHVRVSRYQELGEEIAPLDFVCARALGDFSHFLAWAAAPEVAAGQIVLWLGERDILDVKACPQWAWQDAIAVPQSLRRVILIGTKMKIAEVL
ncbi:MAG: 16S rRNA (guanine(527)-N(7))-methyltransferase RsmG [Acidobacteriota bacterium]|nr:16S rRNA (guanine(527)-N(7))-methyltransferase RsmG [Acidobacteriota bacterium]